MIRSFLKTGGGGKLIEQIYGGSNDKNDMRCMKEIEAMVGLRNYIQLP